MTAYRIYGRYGRTERLRALDVKEGAFVGNLIRATLFYDKAQADKVCLHANEDNQDFEFVVRKVRNA